MPRKKLSKNSASVPKKKLTVSRSQRKSIVSQKKFIKTQVQNSLNKKNKKIIIDSDGKESDKNIKVIKTQNYPKNDDCDSISTNKTDDIPKKTKNYPKSEKKITKKSNYSNKKEKSSNRNKFRIEIDDYDFDNEFEKYNKDFKKNKSQKKSTKTSLKKNKSRNNLRNKSQKNINNIVRFENPYYKKAKKSIDDDYEYIDSYSESDSIKNSDSSYEEYKVYIKKPAKSQRKRTKKYKGDSEFKNSIWEESDISSKTSILGLTYLPCREKEQEMIYDYIKKGLFTNGNYNSLYIAGMPGTGKTACVKTVINIIESELLQNNKKLLKKNSKNKYIPPFTKLFICGTEFPTISNVFKTIYKFIFSNRKRQSNKKYTQLLNKFFSNRNSVDVAYLNDPSNSHIILVIDEIDFLINKSKNLLYNIFNWTTYEGSKLIVISISNTLDLPNKLSQKIKSRMGNNKIMFKPYNKDELITILKSKGVEYEKFTQDALRLSCMKVAAINGDLRRIIQILQRAKEIYKLSRKKNKDGKIDKNFIIKACDDLFNSKFTKVMESLQISEKIIICAVLSKYKDVNENKVKVGDLYDKKDIFINKYNESSVKNNLTIYWEEYKKIIYNLIRLQLLSFCEKPNNNFMDNYITIKFYTDEFIKACDNDNELKPVLDYLINLISL